MFISNIWVFVHILKKAGDLVLNQTVSRKFSWEHLLALKRADYTLFGYLGVYFLAFLDPAFLAGFLAGFLAFPGDFFAFLAFDFLGDFLAFLGDFLAFFLGDLLAFFLGVFFLGVFLAFLAVLATRNLPDAPVPLFCISCPSVTAFFKARRM